MRIAGIDPGSDIDQAVNVPIGSERNLAALSGHYYAVCRRVPIRRVLVCWYCYWVKLQLNAQLGH